MLAKTVNVSVTVTAVCLHVDAKTIVKYMTVTHCSFHYFHQTSLRRY